MNPLGILYALGAPMRDPNDLYDAASYWSGPQANPFGYQSSQILPGVAQPMESPAPLDAYRSRLGSLQAQTYPLNVKPSQAYSEAAGPQAAAVDPLAGRRVEDDLWGGSGGMTGDPDKPKKTDWRRLFADAGKALGEMGGEGTGGYPGVPAMGGGLGILEGIPPQYILPLMELMRQS